MLFMTWIARVGDGLPLAASIPEDEESGKGVLDFQNQAKMLFRKMNQQSPSKCTIETGSHFFHYLIDKDVCYLVLCEQSYSKKLAFSFLEDLAQEFSSLYGKKVMSVNRPYSFIEFDTYIQKARRSFMDSRTRRNLTAINTELQDVQRIMVRNIDDVLQRGSLLSDLDNKAQTLSMSSQRYKKDARNLNMQSTYAKIGAAAVVLLVFVLYFWVFNLHHKLLVNRIRAADAKHHESHGKKPNDRRWEAQHYTWNVDDDEEIPGTVRIVLSAADPQRTKNQVVYSIPDRCFIPLIPENSSVELFDQTSSSVYVEPTAASDATNAFNPVLAAVTDQARPEADLTTSDADDTVSEAFDGDRSIDTTFGHGTSGGNAAGGNNTSGAALDTSRSDHGPMTERDDDPMEMNAGVKSLVKRKGAKGINHFSYCDRATQTTVPPVRSNAIQTEAPPRVSFNSLTNAWIIYDAYHQDLAAQQHKIQQQALINSAAEVVNKGGAPSTSSTAPVGVAPDVSVTSAAAPPATPTVVFQPTGETALSQAGVSRLDASAHVIERMLNQNTYDDIAQVGTDQGQLWPVSNEGEILNWGPVNAHQGPIYTVQWNPFHHQVFISCGTDWLVKIWDQREKEALVVISLGSCVEDCAFSPFSSTAFACMSSNGL
uniref:EOG090X0HBC n=1 Tax=Daphnia longispina TaxID=42846 RepID=A0A4Y7M4S5_9CRUS|nr:EOG090X0HBC [Daphnia longispina]